MAKKQKVKKKIEFGSLVRVLSINKSGVVINKVGALWLVHFVNGTSTLHPGKDLELNE